MLPAPALGGAAAFALHVALFTLPAPAAVPSSLYTGFERPQVVHWRPAMPAAPGDGWVAPPPQEEAPSAASLGAYRATLEIAEAQEAALEAARAALAETARVAAFQTTEALRAAAAAGADAARQAVESESNQAALASAASRTRAILGAAALGRPGATAEYVQADVSGLGSVVVSGLSGAVSSAAEGVAGVLSAEAQALVKSAARVDLLRLVSEQVRGMPDFRHTRTTASAASSVVSCAHAAPKCAKTPIPLASAEALTAPPPDPQSLSCQAAVAAEAVRGVTTSTETQAALHAAAALADRVAYSLAAGDGAPASELSAWLAESASQLGVAASSVLERQAPVLAAAVGERGTALAEAAERAAAAAGARAAEAAVAAAERQLAALDEPTRTELVQRGRDAEQAAAAAQRAAAAAVSELRSAAAALVASDLGQVQDKGGEEGASRRGT